MVRLMLVLAPVMCILSGIGVSSLLTSYMRNLDLLDSKSKKAKKIDSTYPVKSEVSECVFVCVCVYVEGEGDINMQCNLPGTSIHVGK